jgi:hypothetical protein
MNCVGSAGGSSLKSLHSNHFGRDNQKGSGLVPHFHSGCFEKRFLMRFLLALTKQPANPSRGSKRSQLDRSQRESVRHACAVINLLSEIGDLVCDAPSS